MISEHQSICHRLDRQSVRIWNQPIVRRCARRENEMVVGPVVRAAFRTYGSNELPFEIDRFHCGFDDAGPSKGGANRLRAIRKSKLPEQASNRSSVSTKKFSGLTRVISTSVRRRKTD
jgi:hypothetical protein